MGIVESKMELVKRKTDLIFIVINITIININTNSIPE